MKKDIILCSLLFIAGFLIAQQPAIDMSRIHEESGQAAIDLRTKAPARKKARESLYKTEKGKIYKRERDKRKNRWHSTPEYDKAKADLHETKEYQDEFLPIEKDFKYHQFKDAALDKMIGYVESRTWEHPIKAMRSGLNSALRVGFCRNDLRATRDQVYRELSDMIKLEDRILGIEEAKFAMPEYQ